MGKGKIAFDGEDFVSDRRIYSAACERNREALLDVLRRVLPRQGRVIEIAAGTGMHALHFARNLPALEWVPTDPDSEARASIEAWRLDAQIENLQPAQKLDTREHPWDIGEADAILCSNMIHIAPWESAVGLFRGADRMLVESGVIVTYGPYRFPGRDAVPSNENFDASLRARNPEWGVRSIDDVTQVAQDWGFTRQETVSMPANNHSILWSRA